MADYPKRIYPDGPNNPDGSPNYGIAVFSAEEEKARMADKLRNDGPTIQQWVTDGFKAKDYPPKGYASKSSEDQIKAAIENDNKASK